MEYNPSFMHIISAERRIANGCTANPIQSVASHESYKDRGVNINTKALKNPILKINISTLETLEKYCYSRELQREDAARISTGSYRGFITNGYYWVREKEWNIMPVQQKKISIQQIQDSRSKRKAKKVTAYNTETGETIERDTQIAMAEYFNIYPSSLALHIKRGENIGAWEVWYLGEDKPPRMTEKEKMIVKAHKKQNTCKKVMMVDFKGTETEYPSLSALATVLKCGASYVAICCKNGHRCYGNRVYFIVDGKPQIVQSKHERKRAEKIHKPRQNTARRVIISNELGSTEYESMIVAAEAIGINAKRLYYAVRHRFKCFGYTVQYKGEK